MRLLDTAEKILEVIDFGSLEPMLNTDGFYYYLYKTTCIVNNKIYIGVRRSKNPSKDKYIGCGIRRNGDIESKKIGQSHFKRAVVKYGYESFKKEILLYFDSRESSLNAERIVVNKLFVDDKRTLNSCMGGGAPPIEYGENNGNYGKKWSKEKRLKLSEHFRNNRNAFGGNNAKARKIVVVNIFTLEVLHFNCIIDAQKYLNLVDIGKFLSSIGHIYARNYVIFDINYFHTDCVINLVNKSKLFFKKQFHKVCVDYLHNGIEEVELTKIYKLDRDKLRKIKNVCKKFKEGN